MKTIAIIAQKGGAGKTTVAVNLAVAAEAAGIKTALFDLDAQESATVWSDRREAKSPHVEFLTERRLPDAIKAAQHEGFALCIIDTPPAAGPQALTAAEAADLVLIPCRPSLVDLDAIRRTAQLVKSARPTASTMKRQSRYPVGMRCSRRPTYQSLARSFHFMRMQAADPT